MKLYSPRKNRRRALVHGAFVALALAPAGLAAQTTKASGGRNRDDVLKREITSELRLAVARGFDYLISNQRLSGDFDTEFPVAVNALVGLAFLAGGTTEEVGPLAHTRAMRKCTSALLSRQEPNGYFNDSKSAMYGHGFATLYLAELYGMTRGNRDRLRNALERAIDVIEKSQSRNGGWDYTPLSKEKKGRDFSDTSITVCQTMALRAARNLGLTINADVIERARRYIESAQNPDGGFRYRQYADAYIQRDSAFPRSAAGVCILYSLGNYRSATIKRGFEYLYRNYRSPLVRFPFYGHYYCSQAMFQAGGKYWKEYFPWIRDTLLRNQRADGNWEPKSSQRENRTQCTAMALIILQLPYRFLPIHER